MTSDYNKSTKEALEEIVNIINLHNWNDMDEVYPGIFVGSEESAKDTEGLGEAGITHVLNASYVTSVLALAPEGRLSEHYYKSHNFPCEFLGLAAVDFRDFKIDKYFSQAADFIDSALSSNGKVLVHCFMGVSRSATLAKEYVGN